MSTSTIANDRGISNAVEDAALVDSTAAAGLIAGAMATQLAESVMGGLNAGRYFFNVQDYDLYVEVGLDCS